MTSSEPTPFEDAGPRQFLLVTGCYRSGTTLLEKLLHGHPHVCIASQPFPILYFFVKQAFLNVRGLQRRYPLDHLFLEAAFAQCDFDDFLQRFEITRNNIDAIFDQLEDYTRGLWTPEVLQLRDRVSVGSFWDVFCRLTQLLAEILNKPKASVMGVKEVLCEEYVPHLANRGAKIFVIIRDPRDMISSVDFRRRDNLTGDHRPILYSLRVWRKSVAYALAYEDDRNVCWLRYEDLVNDLTPQLERLTRFLNIEPYEQDVFAQGISGQSGKIWMGNSSFSDRCGVSTSSKGVFRKTLPIDVLDYVETVCGPEMATLGYDLAGSGAVDEEAMLSFQEPLEPTHAKFPPDYGRSPDRVESELRRLALLAADAQKLSADEAARWFLDARTYTRLRQRHDATVTTPRSRTRFAE